MSMSTSKSIFHTESILGIDVQVSINVYKYGLCKASINGAGHIKISMKPTNQIVVLKLSYPAKYELYINLKIKFKY